MPPRRRGTKQNAPDWQGRFLGNFGRERNLSFCGFRNFFAVGALDACRLAFELAEVIEARAANFALACDFNRRDGWRVQRKDPLYTCAETDAADGEGGAGGAALLRNHDAFKGLDAFLDLFAFAFLEANVDANGVAR